MLKHDIGINAGVIMESASGKRSFKYPGNRRIHSFSGIVHLLFSGLAGKGRQDTVL
jgi:hypothetical protein